jgi:hypothetical protein
MSAQLGGRDTTLLLAVLAVLVGYLWLFEIRPRRAEAPVEPETPPLLAVPSAAVARVELQEHGRRLTAVRGGAGWTDANGRPWRASVVSDLVDTLGSLRPVMVVDPQPKEPAEYGLGAAARRLEVSGSDGRSVLALELGERNPAWTGIYARRAGEPEVMLIGGVLSWELEKLRGAAPVLEPGAEP